MTSPLNTPDILPSLLSLAGVALPDTLEGDDLSGLFRGEGGHGDRAALFMLPAPFGANDVKAYRGIRTSRHTYVRDSEGPWLLYDNREDPYQKHNLVDNPAHADLRAELESELQSQLERNGDDFTPAEETLARWGYTVAPSGEIPYCGEFTVQSPGPGGGERCRF